MAAVSFVSVGQAVIMTPIVGSAVNVAEWKPTYVRSSLKEAAAAAAVR